MIQFLPLEAVTPTMTAQGINIAAGSVTIAPKAAATSTGDVATAVTIVTVA